MSGSTDPQETLPIRPGEILASKYRVEEQLGIGGMGIVVAATHMQLGKRVAIKVMLPSALAIPSAIERFEREARTLVRLRGEHVAQVVDVGTLPNGALYLVMDLLQGADLATVLDACRRLSIEDSVDYVLQASEAVAEAHGMGIIHRDLKPRNLFLTQRMDRSPLVKVLDFGISKWAPQSGDDHSLTRTNDVVGSPNYMSPEQIKSAKDVDERTDIWSLGVILFELISGRVPFLADGLPQLCAMVLQDSPPRLSELRPEVPEELSNVVARCLEKNPRERFASVAEFVNALEPFAPERSRAVIQAVRMISSPPPAPTPLSGSSPSGARVHVSSSTSMSWADTAFASHRVRIFSGVALALLVVAGVFITWGTTSRWHSETPAAQPPVSVDTTSGTLGPGAALTMSDTERAASPGGDSGLAFVDSGPRGSALDRPLPRAGVKPSARGSSPSRSPAPSEPPRGPSALPAAAPAPSATPPTREQPTQAHPEEMLTPGDRK